MSILSIFQIPFFFLQIPIHGNSFSFSLSILSIFRISFLRNPPIYCDRSSLVFHLSLSILSIFQILFYQILLFIAIVRFSFSVSILSIFQVPSRKVSQVFIAIFPRFTNFFLQTLIYRSYFSFVRSPSLYRFSTFLSRKVSKVFIAIFPPSFSFSLSILQLLFRKVSKVFITYSFLPHFSPSASKLLTSIVIVSPRKRCFPHRAPIRHYAMFHSPPPIHAPATKIAQKFCYKRRFITATAVEVTLFSPALLLLLPLSPPYVVGSSSTVGGSFRIQPRSTSINSTRRNGRPSIVSNSLFLDFLRAYRNRLRVVN